MIPECSSIIMGLGPYNDTEGICYSSMGFAWLISAIKPVCSGQNLGEENFRED